jgi:photosystem II stability/assembly factor-like uncharacterized protein
MKSFKMKVLYIFFIFSSNLTAQWQSLIPYPTTNDIVYIKAFSDSVYLIGTSGDPAELEFFKTTNSGKKWESIYKVDGIYLYRASFLDDKIGWAISRYPYKLWRTIDGGYTWEGYELPVTRDMQFINDSIGFLTHKYSISKSTDGGKTFHELFKDTIGGFGRLSVVNENFIAAAEYHVRISTNSGTTWSLYDSTNSSGGFSGVHFLDSLLGFAINDEPLIDRTTDGGGTWERIIDKGWSGFYYSTAVFHNNTGIITFVPGTSFVTTDRGENWIEKDVPRALSISFINDSTFLVGCLKGLIYKSTDYGSSFKLIGKERLLQSAGISFTRPGYGYINSYYHFLLHTSDNGDTFSKIPHSGMTEIAAVGDSIIMGFGNGKILRSTNSGIDWSEILITPSPGLMRQFSFPGEQTGYFIANNGIYKTKNAGVSWNRISQMNVRAISFADEEIGYAAADYIYKTTDGGNSWQQQHYVYFSDGISMVNENIGAAGFQTIYYTINGGTNWQQAVVNYPGWRELRDIEVFNHNGSIIGYAYFFDTGRLLYSLDTCKTWHIDKDYPLLYEDEFDKIPHLYYDGQSLWAATEQGYVLRRDNFDGLPVSVHEINQNVPEKFMLEQNYPNPFNPSTTIRYSIPAGTTAKVTLSIYDILGNQIAELVNEEKPPGEYQVQWNAESFSSGVYFYQLKAIPLGRQAESFISTKKLLLMK